MSPRSSCPDTDLQRQCFVALYDYNPFQSCTTGRPDLELPLKKGDIMTVIGDMDTNGYYKAEMDGLNGLVPSNFVEDVTSSSFLQTVKGFCYHLHSFWIRKILSLYRLYNLGVIFFCLADEYHCPRTNPWDVR